MNKGIGYILSGLLVSLLLLHGCGKDHDDNQPGDDDPVPTIHPDSVPAFPGAEGGGMYTKGGRGGETYTVTKLTDDGSSGTLRWAVEQSGKRTVVFAVSGNIRLKSDLRISGGNITIAGQTAPGDGITLSGYPMYVGADHVIIRFLRFRLGDETNTESDAVWGRNQKNVIIDHCSMSWSVDECASFYNIENFTLQWSIIAESLNQSVHGKGQHGYGGLWGGYNATFHNNLLAHHVSRNPRFYGLRDGITCEEAHLVNNVIYNWGDHSGYGGAGGKYNLIGNYYKPGPGTKKNQGRIFEAYNDASAGPLYGRFYLSGNYMHGNPAVTGDNWLGFALKSGGDINALKASIPFAMAKIKIKTAQEAFDKVLEHAGASLYRDPVDVRIAEEVRTGTAAFGDSWGAKTGIIDTQASVGGWPQLQTTNAPADSDGDGMPDAWEVQHKLNPNDKTDGSRYSLSKEYTNLEVYLNQLVSSKINFGK